MEMTAHSPAIAACWLVVATAVIASGDIVEHTRSPAHPAVAELGRRLFFEPALSADGKVACASCHQPEHAYADGLARASGVAGRQGTRNAPSIVDSGRQRSLFWDGRRVRLEDQALDPLLNEVEHRLANEAALLEKLRAAPGYPAAFAAAFDGEARAGEAITAPHVAEALAAFERTLISMPSSFDRFLAGDLAAIPRRRGAAGSCSISRRTVRAAIS